jgi:DNA-binding CsgD family transcriptional regulator
MTVKNQLKKSGILLGSVFIAGIIWITFVLIVRDKRSLLGALSHPNVLIQALASALFFLSAFKPRLAVLQPLIFLILTIVSAVTGPGPFGLGFFSLGVLYLFRLGYLEKRRTLKLAGLLAYFFVVTLVGIFIPNSEMQFSNVISLLIFVVVFLVLLYLAYEEKLVVFLKESKPKLSLKEKQLSPAERTYVLACLSGHTAKEIAQEYEVSESTIRNTLARAYKKLEVNDMVGLTALAGRVEIVE